MVLQGVNKKNNRAYSGLGDKMNCQINKPYPKPKVEKKSPETAQVLSHIYASNVSEMTAIHQYIYQTLVVDNEEFSRILKNIAMTEMHHLELLGSTIYLLGCLPVYADCSFHNVRYWNGNDVYYDKDIKTILEINIEAEKEAIHNYQMVLTVIDDIYIKELIHRILEDEYLHLEIFTKLKETNF